jgi:TP901 family phage tail tape measure protein
MTTILDRIKVILEGDTIRLTKSMRKAEAAMKQAGKKMSDIGRRMTTSVTLPVLALGAGTVKAFADFDNALVQSTAIMGDVSTAMRTKMAEAAKEIARTTTMSATAAAESYFYLASAGLSAEQAVAALPQVARFAQAGMFDMATATDLATDAQSALGLTVADAQQNLRNLTRVTDVLVKANTLSNATVQQFSEALTSEAGAALKSFGIDMEEGVAVLAAFADQGIKAQVAGTGLSRILRLMTQAANSNADELEDLGIAIFDDAGKLRNLADIVEDMEDAFRGMSDQERTASLEAIGFTARVQGIILPLLGTSDAIREYTAGLRKAGNTTREIADKQLESFSAQLKIAWNNIVLAAIGVGETMVPALLKMTETLRDAAQAFDGLSTSTKRLVVGIAAFTVVVGPALLVAGKLVLVLKGMIAATRALIVSLGAVATPVLLTVAAVVSLGLAARQVIRHWDFFKVQFTAIWTLIRDAVFRSVEFILGLLAKLPLVGDEFAQLRGLVVMEHDRMLTEAGAKLAELEDAWEDTAVHLTGLELGGKSNLLTWIEGEVEAAAAALDEPDDKPPAWIRAAAEASQELSAALREATALNKLLGDSFDLPAAQAEAYRIAVETMVAAGVEFDAVVGANGETLRELANRYKSLEAMIEKNAMAMDKVKKELKDTTTAADIWGREMVRVSANALESFVAFTTSAERSFRDFINSVLRDLQRFATRVAVTSFFKDVLKVSVPGMQHGGFLGAGQLGIVGEAGPELIQAGRGGLQVQPLKHSVGAGEPVVINQYFVNHVQAMDGLSAAQFFERHRGSMAGQVVAALREVPALRRAVVRGE